MASVLDCWVGRKKLLFFIAWRIVIRKFDPGVNPIPFDGWNIIIFSLELVSPHTTRIVPPQVVKGPRFWVHLWGLSFRYHLIKRAQFYINAEFDVKCDQAGTTSILLLLEILDKVVFCFLMRINRSLSDVGYTIGYRYAANITYIRCICREQYTSFCSFHDIHVRDWKLLHGIQGFPWNSDCLCYLHIILLLLKKTSRNKSAPKGPSQCQMKPLISYDINCKLFWFVRLNIERDEVFLQFWRFLFYQKKGLLSRFYTFDDLFRLFNHHKHPVYLYIYAWPRMLHCTLQWCYKFNLLI